MESTWTFEYQEVAEESDALDRYQVPCNCPSEAVRQLPCLMPSYSAHEGHGQS